MKRATKTVTEPATKKPAAGKEKKDATAKVRKGKKSRGKRYLAVKKLLNREKLYPLAEAIKLLKKVSISSFNASVDVHVVVREIGLHGEVEFPHPTGKSAIVAVADEATLKKIEENKIDFTVLLATSAQMPKLIKYAKVLGPKGLMPNPKNGTITEKPEETIKKLAGKTKYKTEEKAAVMHVTIGRVKDKEKALTENLVALLKTVGRSNLVRAVVAPTMGPGVKIDLGKIG
jgi:large subunit ribosomal protein L1